MRDNYVPKLFLTFQCEDGYGLFVRQSQLILLDDDDDIDMSSSGEASLAATPSDKPKSR